MDASRVIAWLRAVVGCLVAVSAVGRSQEVSGPPFNVLDGRSSAGVYLKRPVQITSSPTSSSFRYRINGASWTSGGGGNVSLSRTTPSAVSGWSGFSAAVSPMSATSGAGPTLLLEWSWDVGATVAGSVEVLFPATDFNVVHQSGNGSWDTLLLPALQVALGGPGGPVTITDPLAPAPEPEPEKEFGDAIMLLDNRTGLGLEVPFGDEALALEPGYNAFPFSGELDEDGLPAARGDMLLGKVVGPDGQTYFVGRIGNGIEGPPQWSSPPGPLEVFPPTSGQTGPVVKLPNAAGSGALNDYVTLPSGMTKGNNVPLPGGMAAGSAGLPPGVTGGTAGALSNGTISGGTSYLPPGYSAGTVKGNTSSGSGSGSGSGSSGSSGGATGGMSAGGITKDDSSTDGGPYLPGASMAGLAAEGKAMGQQAGQAVGQVVSGGLGEATAAGSDIFGPDGFSFWSAPDAGFFSGSDSSWTDFTLPLAQFSVNIKIPLEWLSLIRAILVWGVKIWFVLACIKLVMR